MRATFSRILLAAAAAVLVAIGCTDPEIVYPPEVTPYREGDTLRSPTANISITANGGKPWLITEDFIIPEGVTVTVEAGAEIMVAGRQWIDVQGVLHANGAVGNPIIFTSANSAPDLGQWRGIKLHSPTEQSTFNYCIFSYGAYFDTDTLSERGRDAQDFKGMLAIFNSSPRIERCIVTQNQNNAVFIRGESSRPEIRYNIFTGNDASGVRGDNTVIPENLEISYNCVADNSAPGFILSNDNPDTAAGTRRIFGDPTTVNVNLDSCDSHFNIDLEPLFIDAAEDLWTRLANYGLQSCSPCVDAGPIGVDPDQDGTRADMGSNPYAQAAGELRGRLETNLDGSVYRMSCDVVIPPGVTVTVSPGTRIESTGLFNLEVYGRLLVQATSGSPAEICPCQALEGEHVGGLVFFERGDEPSILQNLIVRDFNYITVNKPGVRFEGCQFIGGFLGGALVDTDTTDLDQAVVFDECTFSSVGLSAIDIQSSSAKIQNCRINGSRGLGVYMYNVGSGVEIMNSVMEACSATAISMVDFCDPLIVNNTIVGSGYYGIHMKNNCLPTLFNNIVTSSGRFGMYAQFSSSPNVSYNNVWNNGLRDSSPANYSPAGLGDSGSNLSIDPQFSDGLYRLGASSPCRDAGHPDSQYNDSDGTRNDMGAWGGPGGGSVGAGFRSSLIANR